MAEVEVRASGPDDVDAMVDLDEQSGYEVYDEYADFFHGAHGSPGVRRAFLGVFSRPGWLHTRRKRFLGQRDPSTGNLGWRTRPGAAITRVSRCAGTQNDADRAASPIRGVADGDRAAEYSGFCTVQAGVRRTIRTPQDGKLSFWRANVSRNNEYTKNRWLYFAFLSIRTLFTLPKARFLMQSGRPMDGKEIKKRLKIAKNGYRLFVV